MNRRDFLKTSSISLGFLSLQACITRNDLSFADGHAPTAATGYGPLIPSSDGFARLPKGFFYKSFSMAGEIMDDGYAVPGLHDGMATFPGPDGTTILVRNHELDVNDNHGVPYTESNSWAKIDKSLVYDSAGDRPLCPGGTTTAVYDTKSQKLVSQHLSLVGTLRNCSGGPTPWGTWITCEETSLKADDILDKDHGYNFEVPASATPQLHKAVPLEEMGRFRGEAVAIDPNSGIVYQTEDMGDGLIYRFIPKVKGELTKGGTLQALVIKDSPSRDTRNWPATDQPIFKANKSVEVEWITMDDVRSPNNDLRHRGFAQGAARFARGEGMFYGNEEVYFACTNGGPKEFGQVFRYKPSPFEGTSQETQQPGTLELFIESNDSNLMQNCDNLTIAPWGDVIICEDTGGTSTLVGITLEGKIYHIAEFTNKSELAGSCFSPDGSTLFVNIQFNPGQTIAITGPWETRKG